MTKRPTGVELVVYVPSGSIELGQIASIGIDPAIDLRKRTGEDAVVFRFTTVEQVQSKTFRQFLSQRWES